MNPEEDYLPSDCESGISGPDNDEIQESQFQGDKLVTMAQGDEIYRVIKRKMVSSLNSYGLSAEVEAIQRTKYSNIISRARHMSFGVYIKAMEAKCDGNPNVKYAWYGCSEKEMETITSHGFGQPYSAGTNGYGVYLSPVHHPVHSVLSLPTEEDGLKYLLLCRVILGKTEEVPFDSGQFNPSSEKFDSGVDNLESPKKYIIWTSRMNSCILPEFVVIFRTSTVYRGGESIPQPLKVPKSAWIPFTSLIQDLSKLLSRDKIKLLIKHHNDHKKQKITRHEMIQRVRQIAGDKLLILVIKSYREKMKSSCQRLNHPSQLFERMD